MSISVNPHRRDLFDRVARCPAQSIRFGNLVEDHWAILHPPIKAGYSPIVTFQGDEDEAREALSPIIEALKLGDGAAALAAAEEAEASLQHGGPRM